VLQLTDTILFSPASFNTSQTDDTYLSLAVFRLFDTCVHLQEGMQDFLQTAALEAVPEVISVFRWLRRRGVSIILVSELSVQETQIVMRRLGWQTGNSPQHLIQSIHYQQPNENPISAIIADRTKLQPKQLVTIGDTQQFLNCSAEAGVLLNIGVTYGTHSVQQLKQAAHQLLMDNILQLPDYLISSVIMQDPLQRSGTKLGSGAVQRSQPLRLRLPFF
jgi:phosphoglycolate phosphatase-like HAD superfamily hydrolase